ncbi:MAG TPA: ATP-binding cassette domain-containing protein [Vicinamibacterales bacterium]|nr:ATP-binding cassette domain-containing protein [Vicinamibacterales bacterium]
MAVLQVSDLKVNRGSRAVVTGASFAVERGESVTVMGASGSGKTSVLRAIAGLDPIVAGLIVVDGVSIEAGRIPDSRTRRALYRRVGMVFQFHHLFEHLSAIDNVCLAPVHVLHQPRKAAERRALELLEQMGIADRAHAMPHELSGGEAQRVAIARALAMGPQVLLMDEPTASLDPARRGDLAAILRQLADMGCALLIASHDEEFVRGCAHRVLTMEEGRIRSVTA